MGDDTFKSSSISSIGTSRTLLGFMRAALKNMTSTSSPSVRLSSSLSTSGIESKSARSTRKVSTLTEGLAAETNGASEVVRRVVLRARRIMWDIAARVEKDEAVCYRRGISWCVVKR